METEQVRAMAASLRANADQMEAHMADIKSSVHNANWQSNAREEYVSDLETLFRVNAKSVQAMRLMAQAIESKAQQWEEIASKFAGPFHYLQGVWESVLDHLNNVWQGLLNIIGKIQVPIIGIIAGPVLVVNTWLTILEKMKGLNWPPSWWPPFGSNSNEVQTGGGNDQGQTPVPSTEPDPVVEIENKPYPQPPSEPELANVTGKGSSYTCATYAKARRPDLGSTQCDNERFKDQAAANYICKFEDKAFQVETSDNDLTKAIGPGYAIVWEPEHPNANDTYGHVAIVEQVYSDHLVYSEAIRINGVYTIVTNTISFDQLNNDLVWLIP